MVTSPVGSNQRDIAYESNLDNKLHEDASNELESNAAVKNKNVKRVRHKQHFQEYKKVVA